MGGTPPSRLPLHAYVMQCPLVLWPPGHVLAHFCLPSVLCSLGFTSCIYVYIFFFKLGLLCQFTANWGILNSRQLSGMCTAPDLIPTTLRNGFSHGSGNP